MEDQPAGWFAHPEEWRWRFAPRVALWPGRTFPPQLIYARVVPGAQPFIENLRAGNPAVQGREEARAREARCCPTG